MFRVTDGLEFRVRVRGLGYRVRIFGLGLGIFHSLKFEGKIRKFKEKKNRVRKRVQYTPFKVYIHSLKNFKNGCFYLSSLSISSFSGLISMKKCLEW